MATSSYNSQHHPLPSVPQHQNPQSHAYQPAVPRSQDYQQAQQQYYSQVQQAPQQQQQRPQQQQYQYQSQQQPQSPSQQQHPRNSGDDIERHQKPRGLSFRSEKSHRSSHSQGKISLTETHAEKEAKRLHSKADPTLAMYEAEPSAVAAQSAGADAALRPLSSIQHKDYDGQLIADPDRSNPTRSRWERPLDTIRSFEAAIDGNYNRKPFYRTESESALSNHTRRNSQYGMQNAPRFPQNGYYGSRPQSTYRPESVVYDTGRPDGAGPSREGYFDGYDNGRNRYGRQQSEPHINRNNGTRNVYPMSNSYQSHETFASGSGSGSEPAGYSTDPSSENSSMGRRSPPKRQESARDYGVNFNQNGYDSRSFAPSGLANSQTNNASVPRKDVNGGNTLRKAGKNASDSPTEARPDGGEKRKSWFTRRFNKN